MFSLYVLTDKATSKRLFVFLYIFKAVGANLDESSLAEAPLVLNETAYSLRIQAL